MQRIREFFDVFFSQESSSSRTSGLATTPSWTVTRDRPRHGKNSKSRPLGVTKSANMPRWIKAGEQFHILMNMMITYDYK